MSPAPFDPDLGQLWDRWLDDGDIAARDQLIVHYSPLVKFVAGRIGAGLPRSVDPGDLVGAGVFGLIDAIERFDRDRGVKFETFASPRIRGVIYDSLRRLDWVPRSVRSRARQVETAIALLEQKTGRTPTDAELAEELRIDETELARWLSSVASTTVGPLDRLMEAGYEPAAETSAGMEGPDHIVQHGEVRRVMHDLIDKLPERERMVLSLYYDEGFTLAEIGRVLGVTESRVSQIHTKSVLHLRSRMTAAGVV